MQEARDSGTLSPKWDQFPSIKWRRELSRTKGKIERPDGMVNTKKTNLLNATELLTHIQPLRDSGSTHRACEGLSLVGS